MAAEGGDGSETGEPAERPGTAAFPSGTSMHSILLNLTNAEGFSGIRGKLIQRRENS